MSVSFLNPILSDPARGHQLQNVRNGRIVAERVLTAFDSSSRRTGLLHRDSMPENSALILAPTGAIHTWFMRFAIDVAMVQKDGLVIKARHAVPPWRMVAALRAYATVELPAGTLARTDTRVGDRLIIASAAGPDPAT